MEIMIKGEAKEIAALVFELQERQKLMFVPETADGPCYSGVMGTTGGKPTASS